MSKGQRLFPVSRPEKPARIPRQMVTPSMLQGRVSQTDIKDGAPLFAGVIPVDSLIESIVIHVDGPEGASAEVVVSMENDQPVSEVRFRVSPGMNSIGEAMMVPACTRLALTVVASEDVKHVGFGAVVYAQAYRTTEEMDNGQERT